MENWNRTGKIKALVLALIALYNILIPLGAHVEQGIAMIVMPLVFASLAIPLVAKFNGALGREIIEPHWNDNPLLLNRPLSFFHFGAFFFLTVGCSMLIGTGIKFQTLNSFGLTSISFGLGILTGIWLTLKWRRSK
ncbi:MAG: hypothetical protein V4590_00415 [Bacteroidota bacterium]